MKEKSTFQIAGRVNSNLKLLKRKVLNQGAYLISYFRLLSVSRGIQEGDIVIDCGANVGDISLLFAKKKAAVYAFEPDPLAFKVLKQRTKKFPNITCYQKGVSTRNETVRFYFHKERANVNHAAYSVSSSIIEEKNNNNPTNFIEIETIDLTEFIAAIDKRVAIVKMDIEGAEMDILNKFIEEKVYEKVDLMLVETHENKIPGHYEKLMRLKHLLETRNINNIKLNWI